MGSGKAADVRIEDASVAEEHCKFEWRGGRLFITDLGSGKGTSFDDNNIMSGVAYIGATLSATAPPLIASVAQDAPRCRPIPRSP